MKMLVYAFVSRTPKWLEEGIADYQKRFGHDISAECVELRPVSRRGGKTAEQCLQAESAVFKEAFRKKSPSATLYVLDERGDNLTTQGLANLIKDAMQQGEIPAFLIGSADGLDNSLKNQSRRMIRLSSLTLPHGLARLLLMEQLYRAVSLIKNHPYHRE